MKNFVICLTIFVLIFGGIGGYFYITKTLKNKNIEEIKKGWYVEITNEYINVRENAHTDAEIIGKVKEGEVYEALDMNFENSAYFWYKIDFNGKEGWIASHKKKPYLKDYSNPKDIAEPYIKYYDDVYKVVSIDDISYDHLEVVEDREDYEITHVVYHEYVPSEYIDQYWILYTVTDAANKSSSKLQKIEFEEKPAESEVLDFIDYEINIGNN